MLLHVPCCLCLGLHGKGCVKQQPLPAEFSSRYLGKWLYCVNYYSITISNLITIHRFHRLVRHLQLFGDYCIITRKPSFLNTRHYRPWRPSVGAIPIHRRLPASLFSSTYWWQLMGSSIHYTALFQPRNLLKNSCTTLFYASVVHLVI